MPASFIAKLLLGATLASAAKDTLLRNGHRKLGLTAGTETNTNALTETGCHAPFSEGGWGYCGPDSCRNNYATCESAGGGPKTVNGVTGSWNSGYPSGSGCATFLDNGATDITDWSPQVRVSLSRRCRFLVAVAFSSLTPLSLLLSLRAGSMRLHLHAVRD